MRYSSEEEDAQLGRINNQSTMTEAQIQQQKLANAGETSGIADLTVRGFRSLNAVSGLYQWGERYFTSPDPDFDFNKHKEELLKGVPAEYHDNFNTVLSYEEGVLLRNQIFTELEDQQVLGAAGVKGMVASGLSTVVDADLPLMFLSGGTYSGVKVGALAARTGLSQTSRVYKAAVLGAAGAEAAVVTETLNVLSRPTGEWVDIPQAAMGGFVFGGVLGTVLPKSFTLGEEHAKAVREEWETSRMTGFPDPHSAPIAKAPVQDSVGAASIRVQENPKWKNTNTRDIAEELHFQNLADGVTEEDLEVDSYFKDSFVSQMGRKAYNLITKTPLASDFDRLFTSASPLAKGFAIRTLESMSGVGRAVTRTASVLKKQYEVATRADFMPAYRNSFSAWTKENGSTIPPELMWNDSQAVREFNREYRLEMASRYFDGVSVTNSKAIRDLADAADRSSAKAVEVAKGAEGERAVSGAEDLEPRSGWWRQIWDGSAIQDVITRLESRYGISNGRVAVEKAIARSYRKTFQIDPKTALIMSKATIARALAKADGVNTDLFRVMGFEDGRYMRELLEANNVPSAQIDRIVEVIRGNMQERGKLGAFKRRNDVDPRDKIAGTDILIADLLSNDVEATWFKYSGDVAGQAAMARNGIDMGRWDEYVSAITDDMQANGDTPLPKEFWDSLRSHFSGSPVGGGLNPLVRRANAISRLSLLNSMGLTQTAELGNIIGMMHLDNFLDSLPKELRNLFNGTKSQAHEELRYAVGSIEGEHLLHSPHRYLDEYRRASKESWASEVGQVLDKAISKGTRLQGYLSGFYKINQGIQRIAGRAFSHRLMKIARGLDKEGFSEMRWKDLGFTDEGMRNRILKYFEDGTVKVENGEIVSYNPAAWKAHDWRDFEAIMVRTEAQAVQNGLIGETAFWMHKDTGAFLMHLKMFTMQALQKQLIRNMRLADPESLSSFFWLMGTSAAMFASREVLAGRTDKLDGERLVKGMLSYGSMTGPVVQFFDPAMDIMGLGDYRVGNWHEGRHGAGTNLFDLPPQLAVLNRIADIPKATFNAVTGNLTKNDIYALQATPLIGNLYGSGLLAQAMRQEIDVRKHEERAAKKQAEREAKLEANTRSPRETSEGTEKLSKVNDTLAPDN